MNDRASRIGLILGLVVTPIALVLAIASGGAGHGHYLFAKIFFPITMLSCIPFHSITLPFIALCFVQFPFYGWYIGSGIRSETPRWNLCVIVGIHFIPLFLILVLPDSYMSSFS